MNAPANLPKSLHTVTVLVNVARELARVATDSGRSFIPDGPDAVDVALIVLGYSDTPDAYGLADKARAILAVRS